mmetsp:Transcript_64094/g.114016  ORF Transcript_64094/g.114016 Transcript_64094/m.114016 type:complete len:82 (+) Transcript_64094:1478-1723(+)
MVSSCLKSLQVAGPHVRNLPRSWLRGEMPSESAGIQVPPEIEGTLLKGSCPQFEGTFYNLPAYQPKIEKQKKTLPLLPLAA